MCLWGHNICRDSLEHEVKNLNQKLAQGRTQENCCYIEIVAKYVFTGCPICYDGRIWGGRLCRSCFLAGSLGIPGSHETVQPCVNLPGSLCWGHHGELLGRAGSSRGLAQWPRHKCFATTRMDPGN
jgi:hypothetical protein